MNFFLKMLKKDFAEAALQRTKDLSIGRFDEFLLHSVKWVRSTADEYIFEFKVSKELVNPFNTLHGGCIATVIDTFSSLGKIISDLENDREPRGGVSVSLTVNYVAAAPLGSSVMIVTCKFHNK